MTYLDTTWRRLPVGLQVCLLAVTLPGLLLHELTHAVVARPFVDGITFHWSEIAVSLVWSDERRWPRICAHLAPLGVGYLVGMAAVVSVVVLDMAVHPLAFGWLALQWLLYVGPSPADVGVAWHYLAQ